MKSILVIALAAIAIIGCTGETPPYSYEVRLDPSMTSEQSEATLGALQEWQSSVPDLSLHIAVDSSECGAEIIDGSRGCIHVAFAPRKDVQAAAGGWSLAIGNTYEHSHGCGQHSIGYSSDVLLAEGLRVGTQHADLLHELGHALGLEHQAHTAMAPMLSGSPGVITAADVAQWYGLRHRTAPHE